MRKKSVSNPVFFFLLFRCTDYRFIGVGMNDKRKKWRSINTDIICSKLRPVPKPEINFNGV